MSYDAHLANEIDAHRHTEAKLKRAMAVVEMAITCEVGPFNDHVFHERVRRTLVEQGFLKEDGSRV